MLQSLFLYSCRTELSKKHKGSVALTDSKPSKVPENDLDCLLAGQRYQKLRYRIGKRNTIIKTVGTIDKT